MIQKFTYIKNFAVFRDFEWNKSVCDSNGSILELKKNNIIFGHNYFGKTTLSRIVRAFEKKALPEKYDAPKFSLKINDKDIQESELEKCSDTIRVFNEDFVRENLAFISNPDASIEPFAIVGEGNVLVTGKIQAIEDELGDKGIEEGHVKTKLYNELDDKQKEYQDAVSIYNNATNSLNSQLVNKSHGDRTHSIKYQSVLFGDQNYNVSKLQSDITEVLKSTYTPLKGTEKQQCIDVIYEQAKANHPIPTQLIIQFDDINSKTQVLLSRIAGNAAKIDELVKDAALQKWVETGKELHHGKRSICAFCGHEISQSRWEQLEKHFDNEFAELNKAIREQQEEIQKITSVVKGSYILDRSLFYSSLSSEIDSFNRAWETVRNNILVYLNRLNDQIELKKSKLFEAISINKAADFSEELKDVYSLLVAIIEKQNNYTATLTTEQKKAQGALRYNEVYDFIQTINYQQELDNIAKLKEMADKKKEGLNAIAKTIKAKEDEIETLKKQINDEEKGAEKVNEYLTGFFGHKYLSLSAIKEGEEYYRFTILRDGQTAYHLSEGECSLVAFCYFMARLEDNLTKGKQPIIWIDDPISSLDANHIFFVYSLINEKILTHGDSYQQLFISTHNLNFLKYLKRLPGADKEITNHEMKEDKRKYRHLIVQRKDKCSEIMLMPSYLKEFITEFNFLFKQIYECATLTTITDQNYTVFYNFGNNARKFLELYLYYKYPNKMGDRERYIKFFGSEDKIPAILVERINNEYSHLAGVFERGETPTEVPEMQKEAKFILETIKNKDREQYEALLDSIGIEEE